MAHLSKFGIGNFRVFEELEELELAPITVFTGTNNSGKSSFIKGLLLIRDNVINALKGSGCSFIDINQLDFTTGEHKTGDFISCKNRSSNNQEITFSLPFYFDEISNEMTMMLKYVLDEKNQLKNGKLARIKVITKSGDVRIDIKPAMNNRWDIWFDMVYFRNELHKLLKKEAISKEQEEELNRERIGLASGKVYFAKKHPTSSVISVINKDEKLKNRPFKYLEEQLPLFWKTWFLSKDFREHFFQKLPDDYYLEFTCNSELFHYEGNAPHNKKEFDRWLEKKYEEYLNQIAAQLIDSGFNFKNKKGLLTKLIENELEVMSNRVLRDVTFIMSPYMVEEVFYGVKNSIGYYFSGIESDISSEDFFDTPKHHYQKSLTYSFLSSYNNLLKDNTEFKEISGFVEKTLKTFYSQFFGLRGGETQFTNIFFEEFLKKGFLKSYYESLKTMSKVEFIEAVRANTQRLYSFSTQGTGFNQLLRDYSFTVTGEGGEVISFIKKWTKQFGLGEDVEIRPYGEGIGMYVAVDNIPLADCGYGITQLVPILLKIATVAHKNFNRESMDAESGYMWRYNPSILLIEEPETNLHPKLQSLLADMFVDAAGTFNIQFIIETHSEYLIRKLQYLTANKEHKYNIKPEDTAIYYFNDPKALKKGDKQIQRIKIREDGILDGNFGPGFFDEASNLIKEIFKLSGAN